MRLYEVMFLLPPDAEEARADERVGLIESLVREAGGSIEAVERRGRRHLAYPIRKHREALDTVVRFRSSGATNAEMERRLRFDPDVMRFLVVRLDEAMRYAEKRARAFESARAERAARQPAAPVPSEGEAAQGEVAS